MLFKSVLLCLLVTIAAFNYINAAEDTEGIDEGFNDNPGLPNGEIQSRASIKPDEFYQDVINSMYNSKDIDSLAVYINRIYISGDFESYEQMVKAQLYLYKKFLDRGDVNDAYLFNLAYFLNNAQKDSYYQRLATNVKNSVQKYISYLPPSLLYLFFKPSFCLLNRAYSEYVYTTTAIEIDSQRRYIFTWRKANQVGSNGAWLKNLENKSSGNSDQLNLEFSLLSKQVQMYAYLERANVKSHKNLIVAWRPYYQPKNSKWTVQLVQNQLVFTQNGFVMCASEEFYDRSRRYVYGYKDNQHTPATKACQWYAKECP